MDPVTLHTMIARPREEVFAYLADVANHPEFSDHFRTDWHLTREDTYGRGAGARFRIKRRFGRVDHADETLIEVQPPRRIVAAGRSGRFNRVRTLSTWTLEPASAGETRVTFEIESQPALPTDRAMEIVLGARSFARSRHKRALRRLRSILEEDRERGARATISGGARKPASGFRL